jgi:predicted metal-dependent phosphoesterase TrpH
MALFELHCHSHHSHGRRLYWEVFHSPREMVRCAARRGMAGIALTDHGVNAGWKEAAEEAQRQGILFIPGIELYTRSGHLIGLGLNEFIPSGLGLEESLERIREQGGLSVAPHPFDMRADGVGRAAAKADAIEAFNPFNIDRVSNALARRAALKAGRPMVAGSDAHTLGMIGACANLAEADGMDSLFREIRAGRSAYRKRYVTRDELTRWSRARLGRSYGQALAYVEESYSPPKAWLARRLMRKFVFSEGLPERALWRMLGTAAMAVSRPYGAIVMVRHI